MSDKVSIEDMLQVMEPHYMSDDFPVQEFVFNEEAKRRVRMATDYAELLKAEFDLVRKQK